MNHSGLSRSHSHPDTVSIDTGSLPAGGHSHQTITPRTMLVATRARNSIGGLAGTSRRPISAQLSWYFDTTTDNLWGNPTPYPGAEGSPWGSSRPGDNLYTNTVLNATDGSTVW